MANATFPKLASPSWREAYDSGSLIKYEAPNKEAVSFIYNTVKATGGHNVDNGEYPLNSSNSGGWSNFSIAEVSNKITVSGFLRGDEYLSSRASLIDSFKENTDDENPAFIFIPLWGRLRVALTSWSIDENASENGQCKIELNLNLVLKKAKEELAPQSLESAKENLNSVASSKLEEELSSDKASFSFFLSSVNGYASDMASAIGKVQGKTEYINKMSGALNTLTSVMSSGTKTVSLYVQALSNVYGAIVNGLLEMKQAADENAEDTISFIRQFSAIDHADLNIRKTILNFSSYSSYDSTEGLTKPEEIETAKASDNFIKIAVIISFASLIVKIEATKSKYKEYINLFDNLYDSIDKNDSLLNSALIDLRVAMIEELKNKDLENERKIKFNKNNNLLNIEHYLKCYNLRELNFIEDSFNLPKEIIYS